MSTWQLVADDLTTLLFDLNDPTGANNAAWGSVGTKFGLGGSFHVDIPHEATRIAHGVADGGSTAGRTRRGLATATWRQVVSATTEANLRLGLGQLARVVSEGGILKIVSGATRYLYFEPSNHPQPYQGKDLELYLTHGLFALNEGVDVVLTCQPFLAAAATSTTPTAVPNDPASAGGRLLSVTIGGDLPTPVAVKSQMGASSVTQRVVVGHVKKTAAQITDLIDDLAWLNLEGSGRGWTAVLGSGVTSVADTNAIGGNAASKAFTEAAGWVKVGEYTRTTKLDSFRGVWQPHVRVKKTSIGEGSVAMRLRWIASATAEPVFEGPIVTHAVDADATATGYVEKPLGTFFLPPSGPLGGLTLELWAQGDSTFRFDIITNFPTEGLSVITAPGADPVVTAGQEMTTPPARITTDPVWTAGIPGESPGDPLALISDLNAAGVGPNTGTAYPPGRHRVTFDIEWDAIITQAELRVVNVTDNSEVATRGPASEPERRIDTLDFTAVAGKLYQPQVTVTDVDVGQVVIWDITTQYLPSIGANEYWRSDPGGGYSVERLDASGNHAGTLGVAGEVPMVLAPGTHLLYLRMDDVPLATYAESENVKSRTQTVTLTSAERYAL